MKDVLTYLVQMIAALVVAQFALSSAVRDGQYNIGSAIVPNRSHSGSGVFGGNNEFTCFIRAAWIICSSLFDNSIVHIHYYQHQKTLDIYKIV